MSNISRYFWDLCRVTVVSIGLAACGGGGGSGEPDTSASSGSASLVQSGSVPNAFPLGLKDTWIYLDTSPITSVGANANAPVFEIQQVTSAQESQGQQVANVQRINYYDGLADLSEAYIKDALGVRAAPYQYTLPDTLNYINFLHLPLTPGDNFTDQDSSWHTYYRDIDYDGRPETVTTRYDISVLGIVPSVTVPAGTFKNCALVKTVITDTVKLSRTGETQTFVSTSSDWYATDVGRIKTIETFTLPNGSEQVTRQLALHSYRIGNNTSTPSVSTVTVSPNPSQTAANTFTASNPLVLTFDRPIDIKQSTQNVLIVQDAKGNPVAGTVTIKGTQLEFVSPQKLETGIYTVTLQAALLDWTHQAMNSGQQWTFNVDGTGPVIVKTAPANGALNVDYQGSVSIEFNKPVLRGTGSGFGSPSVTFTSSRETFSTQNLQIQDQKLIITPPTGSTFSRIEAGTTYTVTVPAGIVTDTYGNPLANDYSFTFTPSIGYFKLPQTIYNPDIGAYQVFGLAKGDLNHDGYEDLVTLGRDAVYITYGQASGLPAAPSQSIPLPKISLFTSEVSVADIDGDSNLEIIVNYPAQTNTQSVEAPEYGYTWAFKYSTLSQSWSNILTIGTSYSDGHKALIDINRDGRLDFIGIDRANNNLEIVLQNSQGGLDTPQNLPLTINGTHRKISTFLVADVTGDGLEDLILLHEGAEANVFGYTLATEISVLPQLPSGGFGAAQTYTTGLDRVYAWTVADMDGDGKNDLVVIGDESSKNGVLKTFVQNTSGRFSMPQRAVTDISMSTSEYTYINRFRRQGQLIALDLNGDGKKDLVVFTGQSVQPLTQGVSLSAFDLKPIPVAADLYMAVLPIDYDRDGLVDIVYGGVFNGLGYFAKNAAPTAVALSTSTAQRLQRAFAAKASAAKR